MLRALLALLLCLGLPALAQEVQPVPALSARVIDRTGTLDDAQRTALEAQLAEFEAQAGPQMVVLMIASTAPEDIAAYAQRVADSWKIGRREVGDGLLIVVAKDDRRLRIEVAKALEGAVPDLAARQIIQNRISPAFKAGDYAGGLHSGIEALQARIRGEELPAPAAQPRHTPSPGWSFEDLGAIFFIAVPVLGAVLTGLFGRKLGSLFTALVAGGVGWFISTSLLIAIGVSLVALLLVGLLGIGAARGRRGGHGGFGHGGGPVIWGGGGGSGWGDGGGFSSGGGGDFGGGGASGDW